MMTVKFELELLLLYFSPMVIGSVLQLWIFRVRIALKITRLKWKKKCSWYIFTLGGSFVYKHLKQKEYLA